MAYVSRSGTRMTLQLSGQLYSYMPGGQSFHAEVGPAFGYFPNPAKTCLVTKQDHFNLATDTFRRSGVNVTPEGRPYLGAAIGTREYIEM